MSVAPLGLTQYSCPRFLGLTPQANHLSPLRGLLELDVPHSLGWRPRLNGCRPFRLRFQLAASPSPAPAQAAGTSRGPGGDPASPVATPGQATPPYDRVGALRDCGDAELEFGGPRGGGPWVGGGWSIGLPGLIVNGPRESSIQNSPDHQVAGLWICPAAPPRTGFGNWQRASKFNGRVLCLSAALRISTAAPRFGLRDGT